MEILKGLDPMLQTFWYIAIPVSVFFLIQTILTFIGSGGADGLEADFAGDLDEVEAPFQLFSLRNLINFLLGFSWSGISLYDRIENKAILVFMSVIVGTAFVAVFFVIVKQILKLAENNSFTLKDTLYKTATVYLRIPGQMSGKGKVQVSAKGSIHEIDAITDQEAIESGAIVRIVKITGDNLLHVERI
ncbi:MAG: NfeD family protein [Cyclobacteriaceae bacterium]|nr:NfeD family protein [Cyclobacteriaceae bacterium]